ncbi:hypothetical protein [Mycolicibacterium litorale]|uniref:Uncharacterized protein n=1 Tax=Mycolicibacterium litorale TaxID=758802 RepID=A0AAD1IMA3_9MYCO|nr:hypothetical protein [Mycolicibacterium litorale]TDY09450.1 hypothetical protein BCL50_1542 [Mycolicibacterium litorale]BBY17396.1 hypothetical protein MLIT_29880 [Mycolicibacterium litorale]
MASHKYIGYVGGLAVAVGVGAAVAVAGQGVAHADTESASSASESAGAVNAGPKKDDTADKTETDDQADEADPDDSDDEAEDSEAETESKGVKRSLSTKLRQSAQQFEAEQVEKLRSVFTPRVIDNEEPVTKRANASTDASADEVADVRVAAEPESQQEPVDEPVPSAAAAEPVPWSPDPFRPDDPEPDDMPAAVLALRNLLVGAAGPEFRPYIREGVEAVYRGSQIVPWVNTVVPAYKIVPAFLEAAQGNKAGAQIIINELLKTTGPVSLLYYGYDQIADLANREYEARQLKEQFYSTVWDTLDPLALLHEYGDHGLRD